MILVHAKNAKPVDASQKIEELLSTISEQQLRAWVEKIAVPRHFAAEPEQNRATANWIHDLFDSFGFAVQRQGKYSNIIALPSKPSREAILVGAHYDSVPMCPGADDNGSAM